MSETKTMRNSFPSGVSEGLSHGTLECSDIDRSRAFLRDYLGLQTLRHSQPSYSTWRGDVAQFIACVDAGEQVKEQGIENRWELSVESEEELKNAYLSATSALAAKKIRHLTQMSEQDGFPWFCIQDPDGNWWGVSTRSRAWLDQHFERNRR